jgi:hypothetical protein
MICSPAIQDGQQAEAAPAEHFVLKSGTSPVRVDVAARMREMWD